MGSLLGPVSHRPASSAPQAIANEKQHVSFKDMVYGNPLGLPRLPIPELKDTVSRYLQVRSFERCLSVFVLAAGNLQVQPTGCCGLQMHEIQPSFLLRVREGNATKEHSFYAQVLQRA